jgi:hypothetical protein
VGRSLLWVIAGLCILPLAGCDVDGQDGRNIVRLVSLNRNQPVFSDVIVQTSDTTYAAADDIAEVVLEARVHDEILSITPGGPFGSVQFRSYTVDYVNEDLNGDTVPDLTDFTSNMNITVPTNGEAIGGIVVLRIADKLRAPLVCLGPASFLDPACAGSTDFQYSVLANITLRGEEETSGHDVEVTGTLVIQIANYADED